MTTLLDPALVHVWEADGDTSDPSGIPRSRDRSVPSQGTSTAGCPGEAGVHLDPGELDEAHVLFVLSQRPAWLSVDIDGADARTHDGYHGVHGGFVSALRAVERAHHFDVPTRMRTHLRSHDLHQIADLARLARWSRVRRWVVSFAEPRQPTADDLPLDEAGFARACREFSAARVELGPVLLAFDAGIGFPTGSGCELCRALLRAFAAQEPR